MQIDTKTDTKRRDNKKTTKQRVKTTAAAEGRSTEEKEKKASATATDRQPASGNRPTFTLQCVCVCVFFLFLCVFLWCSDMYSITMENMYHLLSFPSSFSLFFCCSLPVSPSLFSFSFSLPFNVQFPFFSSPLSLSPLFFICVCCPYSYIPFPPQQ